MHSRADVSVPQPNRTSFEFAVFAFLDGGELVRLHACGGDDLFVQDAHASLADRAHGQLGLERDTELSDEDHVQGRSEVGCDHVRHGDTAVWQTENDDRIVPEMPQPTSQAMSGVHAVDERHDLSFRTREHPTAANVGTEAEVPFADSDLVVGAIAHGPVDTAGAERQGTITSGRAEHALCATERSTSRSAPRPSYRRRVTPRDRPATR